MATKNHRKYDVLPKLVLSPDEERAFRRHMEESTSLPPELDKLGKKIARLCGHSVEVVSSDWKLLGRIRA